METGRVVRLTVTCLSPHRNTALNSPAPQIDHLDLLFSLTSSHPTQGPDSSLDVGWHTEGWSAHAVTGRASLGYRHIQGTGNSTSWHSIGTELTGAFSHILQAPLRALGKFV